MFFPIAGVTINPLILTSIGFIVGILGGFFGVGGGFLAGPFMFLSGVPMNFVIGTDLAHIAGNSIIAVRRHRTLGHVDVRLGIVMVAGTVIGVEAGARIIEKLESANSVDMVVGMIYISLLLMVSAFTAYESIKAIRLLKGSESTKDVSGFQGFAEKIQKIELPPMLSFPNSGIKRISLWIVLGAGVFTGFVTGMLGVGGGFIRMPVFIYVLGMPTHVAVGTDLFEIIFSAGFGTITHALKGNVDILMALVMQVGAVIGARIGATSTQYFAGPRIRLFFSVLPLIGAIMVILKLLGILAL